jgi:hypothetical protein
VPTSTPDPSARAWTLANILESTQDQEIVQAALSSADGDWEHAKEFLVGELSEESIARLSLGNTLADWTNDHLPLVRGVVANPNVTSLSDVALRYNVAELAQVVNPAELPDIVPGQTAEEKRQAVATELRRRLFEAEPTAVLRRMLSDGEIPIADSAVRTAMVGVLAGAPDFDIRTTPVFTILGPGIRGADLSGTARRQVIRQLTRLQRIQAISPVPEAVAFLAKADVSSALSVAQAPREQFVRYAERSGLEPEFAGQIHSTAVDIQVRNEAALAAFRDTVTGSGIALVDDGRSRDERIELLRARLEESGASVQTHQLFPDLDTCACDDCHSVYSPAAYFVELLQYLRNNNLDYNPRYPNTGVQGIEGTALEMLFRRRPDLGELELTCENTNTVLKHVDTALEVMESFTIYLDDYREDTHKPKQATLDAFNIENETTAELEAQPLHVNYDAYCRLMYAIRPFSLPYHQALDRARIWLRYLKTSRYEMLDAFRTDTEHCEGAKLDEKQQDELNTLHRVVLDRSVNAEYLGLTQEQYIHVTREAFWPRRYFELTSGRDLPEADYRAQIGVRPTHEYFGYASEAEMLDVREETRTGLTFVRAQLLPRTGLSYGELSALLETRYLNPVLPDGAARRLTEAVRFRYQFLHGLVDTTSDDPRRRFGRLVDFLAEEQPGFDRGELYRWVRCTFEPLSGLVVLEFPGSRELPLHGYLADSKKEGTPRIGRLNGDGSVTTLDGKSMIGYVSDDVRVLDLSRSPLSGGDLDLLNEAGEFIGFVDFDGKLIDQKNDRFASWLVLNSCDLDRVRLTHLDGTLVSASEYDRLHRFVRLWRSTPWSIAETDQALTGLSHAAATSPAGQGDADCGFVNLASFSVPCPPGSGGDDPDDPPCPPVPEPPEITPDFLAELVAVRQVLERTGLPLERVLSFWADLSTAGEPSPYTRVFGSHNVLAIDPVFRPDAHGNVLDAAGKISDHSPGLQAALGLSSADITALVQWRQLPDELTLHAATLLYRHAVLAKYLRVRVSELVKVVSVFGDPFTGAHAAHAFLEDWQAAADAGVTYRQLAYLLHDEDDPARPVSPSRVAVLRATKAIYDGLTGIEASHRDLAPDAYGDATDDRVRSEAGLIFEQSVVEGLGGLLDGTSVYTEAAPAGLTIEIPDDLTGMLAYVSKSQGGSVSAELRVTGILTPEAIARAKALSARPAWSAAIERVGAQPRRFFAENLRTLFDKPGEADKALLCGDDNPPSGPGVPVLSDGTTLAGTPLHGGVSAGKPLEGIAPLGTAPRKRLYLLRALLPELRARLAHKLIVETVAGESGLAQDVVDTLLTAALEVGTPARSAMDALLGLRDVATTGTGWRGYLLAPAAGTYSFVVTGDDADPPALTLNGAPVVFPPRGDDSYDGWSSDPVLLKAGTLYALDTGELPVSRLQWRTTTSPATPIPASALLPSLVTDGVDEVFRLVGRAAILVSGLALTSDECAHLQRYGADFSGFDFNGVTLDAWRRAQHYVTLRKALPRAEASLLDLFGWAARTDSTAADVVARVAASTGWDTATVAVLIASHHFDLARPAAFRNEVGLLRMLVAICIATTTGASVDQLFVWANPTSSFGPSHRIATGIQAVMRARFTQDDWEQAVRPLYDELREHQKQALIDYLLTRPELRDWGVTDADSLFEFFLLDVQVGVCRETSRIKQAISAVQTFIQRCMLGLEKDRGVGADVLDRDRWTWMQKYVTWEAQRELFVTPQRWLREELRDDKSPFFRDLEAALLQKDINPETVAEALRAYVVKVDEVANLETVGIFKDGLILHVFARTRTAPHTFWYRRYDTDNGYWYPWEPVEVDIASYDRDLDPAAAKNGTFLIPVAVQGRLVLMWPLITRKAAPTQVPDKTFRQMGEEDHAQTSQPGYQWEIKLAWSELRNGRWSQKQVTTDSLRHPINPAAEPPSLDGYEFLPRIFSSNPYLRIDVYDAAGKGFGGFTFDGSHLYLGALGRDESGLQPSIFHYRNDELHSLQANNFDDSLLATTPPYFKNSADIRADFYPNGGVAVTAHHPFIHELLGHMSSGDLRDLCDYYLHLDAPTRDLVFGKVGEKGGYHELRTPYALYTWESCFHAQMLLADRLITARQFDEALKVLHTVVNPFAKGTDDDPVWRFAPFQSETDDDLDEIFLRLDPNQPDKAISEWRDHPFQPHVVARNRPAAYKRWAAITYVKAWIAYGDYYFRQNTLETLPLATQCYVVASHVLGPRGEDVPPRGRTRAHTYNSLIDAWDAFSNALVDLEVAFPYSSQTPVPVGGEVPTANIFGSASALYFCIPGDPALKQVRDMLDQRLFYIRNCRDINGVLTTYPLFEAKVDPELLVEAAAQGLSLSSVLSELNVPMPNYRFSYLLQKALEACAELKALGNAVVSARERKDGEELARLRTTHEHSVSQLVLHVRTRQLEEANSALAALEHSRTGPVYRLQHHLKLIGEDLSKVPAKDAEFTELPEEIPPPVDDSGLKLIQFEKEEMDKAGSARDVQKAIGIVETLASILHAIPATTADGKPFGIGVGLVWGGPNLGNLTQAVARGIQIRANDLTYEASNAGRKAAFQRQLQDRVQQANAAGYEIKNVDKQILTQRIRADIAAQEITNQQAQIDNSQAVLEFLAGKYSNTELYSYMDSQLSILHYQTYTLAYELAKKAEQLFRFERNTSDSFIKFGYWDPARDGLLAGEQLFLALKQLESAYHEKRGHDYELTQSISLAQLNPIALIKLRETGICEFDVPEVLFDMAYPGHLQRRIKTVSLQIPCTVGPHTGLNATVRLLSNRIRTKADDTDYAERTDGSEDRFSSVNVPITVLGVSTQDMESGVFEVNLNGERYGPCEGGGVIARWRVELPVHFRQFDYTSIRDTILRIRYTSLDGGDQLREAAKASVAQFVKSVEELSQDHGLFAIFDVPTDFADAWYSGMNPPAAATERVITVPRLSDRLPIFTRGYKQIVASDIYVYVAGTVTPALLTASQGGVDLPFTAGDPVDNLTVLAAHEADAPVGDLTLTIGDRKSTVDRLLVVERYTLA